MFYLKRLFNSHYFHCLLAGGLLPLAFAPLSMHGLAIIALTIFCFKLQPKILSHKQALLQGFFFGLGYFSIGVSWVIISIHDYGHLNYPISALLTLLFIAYLACFNAVFALLFYRLNLIIKYYLSPLLFASLWVIVEWLRAHLFTGFPWLIVGYSQIDTPLQYFAPIIGTYGLSFLVAMMAGLLVLSATIPTSKRFISICLIVIVFFSGYLVKHDWVTLDKTPLNIGVVQANISMRDKWDNALFWQLVHHYEQASEKLYDNDVIIWPESAIPVSENYLKPLLSKVNEQANKHHTAVVLGIPKVVDAHNNNYYNALITLGNAKGTYLKKHLVPFGEYIPSTWLHKMSQLLAIPLPNTVAGHKQQTLVQIKGLPIATLICYELAFSELMRQQLPQARWLVTLSDDGWFGHSWAMEQHLEMARMRSLESGRYQVMANNNGLSSVIDSNGAITRQLKPFESDNLSAILYPTNGVTPWTTLGDDKLIICALLTLAIIILIGKEKHE